MGEVWRATDERVGRDVAVKLLRQEYAQEDEFVELFRWEARNAAALVHPGAAHVYDFAQPPDSPPFLVMELVSGQPLSAILVRTGCLSPELTLGMLAQMASVLEAAHAAGIIHCDIKPGNLLVTGAWRIKLTDFGISRARGTPSLARTGMVFGTPGYLPPELLSAVEPTPASDVYSLGAVAYECLSGQPMLPAADGAPVDGAVANGALANGAGVDAYGRGEPVPLPDEVPAAVRELVMAAVATEPAQRPSDGRALRSAVDAVRRGLDPADRRDRSREARLT